MKSADIRKAFLEYFQSRGHEIVSSSSLVPVNDATLLFTNAGMVQFKDVFLGHDQRSYTRATSSQRCVRAGGKHNDLENVGYTARHHTFFEMLGNFSFGDYFKREAIAYAWEFLTVNLGLPPEKLWVTVYQDDQEAEDIWFKEVGINPDRFSRLGEKDNFWSMGETGPCGPCTEIFYDHGPSVAGGPPGSPEEDGDRYIEIWNLVFMQYDRSADGVLTPLPKPSVDTGMGLERIAAVLQGVHSNYEIDLFRHLIADVARIVGVKNLSNNSLKVIADHIRAAAFLIADGVLPSNEDRGYVLRRIIRRALRHGHKLGHTTPFFHQLVSSLAREMGAAYPELVKEEKQIAAILLREEEQFARTLDQGMGILEQDIRRLKGKQISGQTVFTLYDTYGFPPDLTADIARERGLTVDMAGFDTAMDAQRARARAASTFSAGSAEQLAISGETTFDGYEVMAAESGIVGLFMDGEAVEKLVTGESGVVVLEATPFYGEAGGQAGDTGVLEAGDRVFEVTDTVRQGKLFLHRGVMQKGQLIRGEQVTARIDQTRRIGIARNHSATHLLHAALRKYLGSHVTQKGSLVESQRLRFDFSHPEAVTADQLQDIEEIVNQQILANSAVITEVMSIDAARDRGAMALFGEKYDDEVRVLSMGQDFSLELCGGTHVQRTGDIGLFRIVSESGIAAGVRRIEAVSGEAALAWTRQGEVTLQSLGDLLRDSRESLVSKVQALLENQRQMEKTLEKLKQKASGDFSRTLVAQAETVAGVQVLVSQVAEGDGKSLRTLLDKLRDRMPHAVVLLAVVNQKKIALTAGVFGDAREKVHAGELVRHVALLVGGKGGGRPDMAQGGGTDPAALADALVDGEGWIRSRLA